MLIFSAQLYRSRFRFFIPRRVHHCVISLKGRSRKFHIYVGLPAYDRGMGACRLEEPNVLIYSAWQKTYILRSTNKELLHACETEGEKE